MSKLKEIFESNYSPLCNYANAIINDFPASEDIVQSIFIELWENNKLNDIINPAPYLMKCVKYKCIDFLKRKKGTQIIITNKLPDKFEISTSSIGEEDIAPTFAFLTAQLPPKTRRVFLMRRTQGLSYKEIAKELKVSVNTVENQLAFARKTMRKLLKDQQILNIAFLLIDYYLIYN